MTGEISRQDDGWRPIDDNAPKDGHCLLANEDKSIAWESYEGVTRRLKGMDPKWWRLDG